MCLRWIVVATGGILAGLALVKALARRRASQDRSAHLGGQAARPIRVDGRTMHARVSVDCVPYDRLPVILVHRFGMSSRYIIPLARHLAPHFGIYAPAWLQLKRQALPNAVGS